MTPAVQVSAPRSAAYGAPPVRVATPPAPASAPVVIVGLDSVTGLQTARIFARRGIRVIGLAANTFDATPEGRRRLGLSDVFVRPIDIAEVTLVGRRLIERRRLQEITGIVGETDAMNEVLEKVVQIAPVNSTVLVTGESGTGKELVARAIHQHSLRSAAPLVPINLASLSPTLVESELFGHARGAFTGAETARQGLLEIAHGGTVFFDEAADIPQPVQVKLLRVLEQQGTKLAQIGVVDGLGKGERIYSVRFIGPRGYVVTFRQTDPLYTIDLTDPDLSSEAFARLRTHPATSEHHGAMLFALQRAVAALGHCDPPRWPIASRMQPPRMQNAAPRRPGSGDARRRISRHCMRVSCATGRGSRRHSPPRTRSPTICRPTGKPFTTPAGIEMPGRPARLTAMVLTSSFSNATMALKSPFLY